MRKIKIYVHENHLIFFLLQPLARRDWNGEPRGYRVFYRMMDATDFTPLTLDNGINMDSTILGGLQEWMEYQVKMMAFNDVGDSAFSPVTVERTRESGINP